MSPRIQRLTSSVGLKFLMAATGILLFGFVVAHLAGNLQVFAGPDQINAYAQGLKDLGPLLWVARIGLLAILVVHLACAAALTRRNRAARPVAYAAKRPIDSTLASRTMLLTGAVVLLFVIYHLMHFTFGVVVTPDLYELRDPQGRHDVYSMMVAGFQQAPIAVTYIAAMVVLGLHLTHGLWSAVQSAGWLRPRYRPVVMGGAAAVAWLVVLGNISMPIAAWLGGIDLPDWYPLGKGQA